MVFEEGFKRGDTLQKKKNMKRTARFRNLFVFAKVMGCMKRWRQIAARRVNYTNKFGEKTEQKLYRVYSRHYTTKGLSIYDGLLMMSGLHRLRCFFVPPIFEFWVWFIATKYLRPSVQKESIKLFFKCYFNNHSIITNELSNSWIKST